MCDAMTPAFRAFIAAGQTSVSACAAKVLDTMGDLPTEFDAHVDKIAYTQGQADVTVKVDSNTTQWYFAQLDGRWLLNSIGAFKDGPTPPAPPQGAPSATG
jgi:hypothetical protein